MYDTIEIMVNTMYAGGNINRNLSHKIFESFRKDGVDFFPDMHFMACILQMLNWRPSYYD